MNWKEFVVAHGWRARAEHLAFILKQDRKAIGQARAAGCVRLPRPRSFQELFALWNGRAPGDHEWPAPRRFHRRGQYEWLGPEFALLGSLVGRMGTAQIAEVLTRRLRKVTGDSSARRTRHSVLVASHRMGLQQGDLVGGLSVQQAGRLIGSIPVIQQAVDKKAIGYFRVGRRIVIPREAFDEWKAKRVLPPKGFIPIATIRQRLGISSDSKLPEFCNAGWIPTAVRCNPFGAEVNSSKNGTWYVSAQVARKLVADRHAGRPMPWHGKVYATNLKITYALWLKRRHPSHCATCRQIWGGPPPHSREEFGARYGKLAQGAKRHLTRVYSPGLTISQVAVRSGQSVGTVRRAVANGVLPHQRVGRVAYVTKTNATVWVSRGCPTGETRKEWLSLSTAKKLYGFSLGELRSLIDKGVLRSRMGVNGAEKGIQYVLRHQVCDYRYKHGFTLKEAARRAGLSIARTRQLLEGADWRGATGIPLDTVNAIIKRHESAHGFTLPEAARELGKPLTWIRAEIRAGTARVTRASWDRRRLYLTGPQLERLRRQASAPRRHVNPLSPAWLLVGKASTIAGVSIATIAQWGRRGQVRQQERGGRMHYLSSSLRARALRYWRTTRFKRSPARPDWVDQVAA